ncbi:HlyD family efflux transporter periplasmic adaptor subunit [Pseudalkalibacillus caeni]|uniref:HlyD family efflux transporter periplasmic adaptor subunit n=1 Tax=Exobacillus caeni TaxID=2574798 RepID=A0A5R9FE29_9BACL|nr:HlyD family efflux transporter periplasmic adaptor subunit [Pseudalkalibacillus caeni]
MQDSRHSDHWKMGAYELKAKWIVLTVTAVFIIAFISLNSYLLNEKIETEEELETLKVKQETFKEIVPAEGIVIPAQEENVYQNEKLGPIAEMNVQEGQQVTVGTELFRYENEEYEDRIEQLNAEIDRLEVEADQQEDLIGNYENQLDEVDYDMSATEEENQQNQSLEFELERKIEEAEYEKRLTELKIEQAKQQIDLIEEKDKELIVTSETAGIITEVNKNPGNNTDGAQEPVVHIVSSEHQIKGFISEYELELLEDGQPVEMMTSVIPSKRWKGAVSSISDFPVSKEEYASEDGKTYYSFVVDLENEDMQLKNGYHVSLDVAVKVNENAPVITSDALVIKGQEQFVLAKTKKGIEMRAVTIGQQKKELVEIVNGLKAGEKVVRNPSPELVELLKPEKQEKEKKKKITT